MAHAVVVGAGAIGSHLLGHLGRMAAVTAVTVIDRDRYEQSNLLGQNIYTPDVGKSKAQVHARRLRQINRDLRTRAFEQPFEDLPLTWLQSDVILAAVDSRRTRMAINLAAWRLSVPWINAGVDADGMLARVQVFTPGPGTPCLECAWSPRDYELVEQAYPCQAQGGVLPPTQAPSALAALAASLQAIECGKLLAGERDHVLAGRDVMVDARHSRHFVTCFRHNPECHMPDHEGWAVAPYDADPASTTLDELLATASALRGAGDGPADRCGWTGGGCRRDVRAVRRPHASRVRVSRRAPPRHSSLRVVWRPPITRGLRLARRAGSGGLARRGATAFADRVGVRGRRCRQRDHAAT